MQLQCKGGAEDSAKLSGSVRDFLQNEDGGGTVMGLLWFILLVGICGLAVDITDGFRSQTMLQATADAAALAAVMDLPDEDQAVQTALDYAENNMAAADYGSVLIGSDVDVGTWNHNTKIFTLGGVLPDAVRVRTRRSQENENPVPVNFLRIVGLLNWNVTTHAIAQRFLPDCLTDGLVARGFVDMSSNNTYNGDMCVHGQRGVHLSQRNAFGPEVRVSMPDVDQDLVVPADNMDGNPRLAAAISEQSLEPRMVNHTDEIIRDLMNAADYVTPDYIDANEGVITRDENYDFSDVEAGNTYHIDCSSSSKTVNIPRNTVLTEVAIISECRINVGTGVQMTDVFLASLSHGNNGTDTAGGPKKRSGHGGAGVEHASIHFDSGVTLGADDNCSPGGGVQIFSNSSVQFTSNTIHNGVQIVAAGDVDLGTRGSEFNGINVQSGGDITVNSNNTFGDCTGGAPALFTVNYYRLVF
jgi:Flp pilus assembly protein TadG